MLLINMISINLTLIRKFCQLRLNHSIISLIKEANNTWKKQGLLFP